MSIRTRAGALLAAGALVASGLALAGPAPTAHAADVPSPEARAAVTWLNAQLVDGLVSGEVGTTMDYGLSLIASETQTPALLDQLNAGISGGVDAFIAASWQPNGARAKAAYYYQVAGLDAGALLSGTKAAVDDTTGQIDGGTPYSQAWAVLALETAGDAEAPQAKAALLATQCPSGAWSYDCAAPDPDITAYSVLALLPFDEDATAQAAVDKAVAWLKSVQSATGGIAANGTENSNSTGLAAWALGEAGESAAAAKSASWVAARQLTRLAGCTSALDPEAGGIAYSSATLATARTEGTIANRKQWALASAQSLAGLASLSNPVAARVYGPTGYVRAGTVVTVRTSGLRVGQPACLAGFGNVRAIAGPGYARVTLPAATGNRVLALRWVGGGVTTTIKTLGAKTFRPKLRSTRVRRGGLQVVTTTGLAPYERFTVRYAGRAIRTATATSTGVARVSFRVGRVKGLKSVAVLGQFSNRRGTTTFRVVR